MAPMQWPGTTAVLEKAAPQEREAAEEPRIPKAVSQAPAGGGTTPASAQGGLELPCGDDPELFFAEAPDDVEFAKSLCGGCAARIECLAGAIERREPWGVWGGELFLRGEIVPFKRPRGRPRKATIAA
jgi:WhiB family transcriptional regulator, redox-sensing transcriptional regulator